MCDFIAAFPKANAQRTLRMVERSAALLGAQTGCEVAQIYGEFGSVAVTATDRWTPRLLRTPTGDGFLVTKGVLFSVRGDRGEIDLAGLLEQFLRGEPIDWNAYEGAFALVLWDPQRRRGFALNDQTSILNLYYTEDADGVYLTTTALPLARTLGRGLNPAAVREFLARGALIAPSALFHGFYRLNVGEHLRFEGGHSSIGLHWCYPQEQKRWSFERSAEEAAVVSVDRIRRFTLAAGSRVITDLTSGFDSRLLASAADCAGLSPTVTVNGALTDEDVTVAHKVACAAGWPIRHFDPVRIWREPISPDLRMELVVRTDGNLVFTEAYHHKLTRPGLSRDFDLHGAGVGGEFIRYHPWGQEFFGIGRRRRANIPNILAYRFLQNGLPPAGLFRDGWLPHFRQELADRLEAVCSLLPGSLTTQQLDAVHAWKQTGHSSLYASAHFNWLPTAAPWMGAGFLTMGMTTPWWHRLSTRLTRHVIHMLSPRAAAVVTHYGGTASPMSLANFPRHLRQSGKQARYLFMKVSRTAFHGLFRSRSLGGGTRLRKPYFTDEFRSSLDPQRLLSCRLYNFDGLRALLGQLDGGEYGREPQVLRLSTLEEICRMLDFRPDEKFLLGGAHPGDCAQPAKS